MSRFHYIQTIALCTLLCLGFSAVAKSPIAIFSHNDYTRTVPFYEAYAQGVYAVEADVFLQNGKLLVGHEVAALDSKATLRELYIEPIVKLFTRHGGHAYKDRDAHLQLLIELKSETEPTLRAVIAELESHPEVFNRKKNPNAVQVVITGRVPSPENFTKYPEYLLFDGDLNTVYTPAQLNRIAMISTCFRDLSTWNGKGTIMRAELPRVEAVINAVHAMNKPIRFWDAPDCLTSWYTFYNMGVDYLNTDQVEACNDFFEDFANKNFEIAHPTTTAQGVTRTNRLDKTTRDFKGFSNEKLQLSKAVAVYTPTYQSDGADRPIKNVIFLIGDGMGLSQIAAAQSANRDLSMLQMRYLGLQRSWAKDAYTTDSAAAGSALATGEAHCNRYIAMNADTTVVESLSDFCHKRGQAIGVVTLGNVADATPAAFYGHWVERDDADLLTSHLLDGKLSLLCGSGIREFEQRRDQRDLIGELKQQYAFIRSADKIATTQGKVICIDEKMGDAAEEANLGLLADVTRQSIAKLQSQSQQGFFLMVEGAKIDYAGHSKCLPGSIIETLSFDLAVAEALKFADANGETLVIVTADHETGGLTLLDGDLTTGRVTGYYVTNDHTPTPLPVFAYGPHADTFCGAYENTQIARRIKQLLNNQ